MRRIENPQRTLVRVGLALGVLLGASGTAVNARAHSLLVSRGEAVIRADRIDVTLEVMAEDYLHLYGLDPDVDGRFQLRALREAATKYGEVLVQLVSVFAEDGQPLPGSLQGVEPRWGEDGKVEFDELRNLRARYDLSYTRPVGERFLTWQLTPLQDGVILPLQIVIRMAGEPPGEPCLIRLTSGGNAETVEVQPSPSGGIGEIRRVEELREVSADITNYGGMIRITLSIPLPILETFVPMRARSASILTGSEQRVAEDGIRALLARAVTVSQDGTEHEPELRALSWAGMVSAADRSREDINFLAGHVQATLEFSGAKSTEPATIRWNLFNAAVLSASTTLRDGCRTRQHRFSTYDDTLVWTACRPGAGGP